MQLTREQLAGYDRDGFLILQNCISRDEVGILQTELDRLAKVDCEHTRRERTGAIRTMYRVHEENGPTASRAFRALCRLPRTLGAARELMNGEDTYVFHTKINLKPAIEGSMWSWHQDFGTWKYDGVPTPDIMTCLVTLDEADEVGGALYLIPGSHKLGSVDHVEDDAVGALNQYALPRATLMKALEARQPVAVTGAPGTVVFFHANLVHGSGHNMSARDRRQLYIVYNPVRNKPIEGKRIRGDHVSSKNQAPVPVESDDGILRAGTALVGV